MWVSRLDCILAETPRFAFLSPNTSSLLEFCGRHVKDGKDIESDGFTGLYGHRDIGKLTMRLTLIAMLLEADVVI